MSTHMCRRQGEGSSSPDGPSSCLLQMCLCFLLVQSKQFFPKDLYISSQVNLTCFSPLISPTTTHRTVSGLVPDSAGMRDESSRELCEPVAQITMVAGQHEPEREQLALSYLLILAFRLALFELLPYSFTS